MHAPQHDAVLDIANRVQKVLEPWASDGIVAPVDPRWLHLTVTMITDTGVDRTAVAEALRTRLAYVPAFGLSLGSPLITNSAVLLDSNDTDGGFEELYTAVRCALTDVGADASYDPRPAHLTLAYGRADADSGPVASRIRSRAHPAHANMQVDEVQLVDVVQDPVNITYTWTELATIALAPKDQ